MFDFKNNPFFILEVAPQDKRTTIISKAEEKAFFAEGNEIEYAQSLLIHPTKRLIAELNWFFNCSTQKQASIFNAIRNSKEMSTEGLSGISRLNAAIHNFIVMSNEDRFEVGYAILDIDNLFESINIPDVLELINQTRAQSGFSRISETDIIDALGNKRTEIKQIIAEKLESFSTADYIELVTIMAEKCIADRAYDDGVVIGDVIDNYEIRMKSAIDEKEEAILSLIAKIDDKTNKPLIDLTINNIVAGLKDFNVYANPLQIKSASGGTEHEQSLHIARECRELAIKLHNNLDCSDASFKLIHALKEVFVNLIEFSDVISNDEIQITKIRKEKEQFKKDLVAHRQANKRYTVNIRGNRFAIPPFCTCCMKPTSNKENVSYSMTTQHGNTKTTRSIAVDLPICDECLKHRSQYNWLLTLICSISIVIGSIFMAIFMAAEMEGFPSFLLGAGFAIGAYYIISAVWNTKPLSQEHSRRGKSARIFSMFMNNYVLKSMPNASDVTFTFYNWEYAQLFREANKDVASEVKESTEINTARSTSVLKANEHHVANMVKMLGVFVVIALIIGAAFSSANSSPSYSSSNNNNNGYQSSTNSNNSNSSTSYTITLNKQGGSGGSSSVTVKYGNSMPSATAPTKSGYTFGGYYSSTNGSGTKYYDANMRSVRTWDKSSNTTLYAYWIDDGKITLSSSNFEDYFTITTSAEYRGNTVTISYSIKPKSTAYAADSSSSSSITVKLRGGVYPYSFSTSPTYSSTETITLYKSSGYKKSGTITVYVSSGADEIYWGTDVTSASGTIYK